MDKYKSRKFLITVLFGAIVLLNDALNLGIHHETIVYVAGLFGTYIVAQGTIDFKNT